MQHKKNVRHNDTSWERSSKWYNKIVGSEGHYYHQKVIFPGVLKLLDLRPNSSVLDIGCGQGVLARQLPKGVHYQGVDLSDSLVQQAKKFDRSPNHSYTVGDVTKKTQLSKKDFTHAVAILSLQNMREPEGAVYNAAQHLTSGGRFVIVLNHPMFRIPRQSGWGTNPDNKVQYRWVAKYMSAMEIPIQMHPGEKPTEKTWSFHRPLSDYSAMLKRSGFVIEAIEEWVSDKKSTNKAENRSKEEIPLFMAIMARKNKD